MSISIWIPVIVSCITATGAFITTILNRVWQIRDKKSDKLDALSAEVKSVKDTLDNHIAEDEMRDILQARRRIIDFSDECRRGTKHSEEHFNNVLSDIDTYERYCNEHPLFENRQAVSSIAFVAEVYDKCKRDNDFI